MKNGTYEIMFFYCDRMFYLFRKNEKVVKSLSNRPVSILKPLKGADKNLHANLNSFFTMKYPNVELIFCIEDIHDPAVDVVKNLMSIHPNVDSQIVHGGSKVGINPKINNMHPGYLKSKHDLIMISDDKVVIQPYALQEMVNKITSDESIGCVFQTPSIISKKQEFSALFLKFFSCVFHSPGVLGVLIQRPYVVSGMSNLYRKEIFEKAGGIQVFSKYLLEDVKIHLFCHENGWKVKMSRFRGLQNQEDTSISIQWRRFRRWFSLSDMKSQLCTMAMFLLL